MNCQASRSLLIGLAWFSLEAQEGGRGREKCFTFWVLVGLALPFGLARQCLGGLRRVLFLSFVHLFTHPLTMSRSWELRSGEGRQPHGAVPQPAHLHL